MNFLEGVIEYFKTSRFRRILLVGGLLMLTFQDARMIWVALLNQLALLFSYVPYFLHRSNEWVFLAALLNLAAVVVLMKGYREHLILCEK